jgi:hypothetical protein
VERSLRLYRRVEDLVDGNWVENDGEEEINELNS